MKIRMPLLLLTVFAAAGSACSQRSGDYNCDLLFEVMLSSDEVKRDPNPIERALSVIEAKTPAECKGNNPAYLGSRAYYLYGLGRIDESEQLIQQLDWRRSDKAIVLRTAVMLIVHERRLGNDLNVAEELARRVVQALPSDPKSYLLLGEALMGQSRHDEVVSAYKSAKQARAASNFNVVNAFDINFVPHLVAEGEFEDALAIFNAAQGNSNYRVWENETLVLSGLLAAEALGRRQDALSIISEVERTRPEIAASADFQQSKRNVLLLGHTPESKSEDASIDP